MCVTPGFGNLWLLEVGFFLLLAIPAIAIHIVRHGVGAAMSNKLRHSSDLPRAAVETLRHGNLIEAIRLVSRERGIGFKEAKAQVEIYIASQPALKKKMDRVLVEAQRKFIRWMIGLFVLAAIVAYYVNQKFGS